MPIQQGVAKRALIYASCGHFSKAVSNSKASALDKAINMQRALDGLANKERCYSRRQLFRKSCQRVQRLLTRASAPKPIPSLGSCPIGIHSKVWVGGWSAQEAEKAIAGTKRAGFDLIECKTESDT